MKERTFRLSKEEIEHILHDEKFTHAIIKGKSVAKVLNCSPKQMGFIYRTAHSFIENERYQDAMDAFSFLVLLDPNKGEFWLGLGMALQKLSRYEAAVDSFELAAGCDTENPVPYFYLAKSLFAIHEHVAAREALEMVIIYAEKRPEYSVVLHQARLALAALNKRS